MNQKFYFVGVMMLTTVGATLFSAPAGTLDTTFNVAGPQQGTVATSIDGSPLTALSRAVAIQSDGKIVVAGVLYGDGVAFSSKVAVARFNTDGTLDTSFNVAGPQQGTVSTTVDNEPDSEGYDVAIQPDGKILVSGVVGTNGPNKKSAVVRFNSDGTLDTTFNVAGPQQGTVSTTMDNRFMSASNNISTIALQTDGKIVITGYLDDAFALARFNTDGTLDATFNPLDVQPGTLTETIGTTNGGSAFGVAIQTDGKIVVEGTIYNVSPRLGALARFNSDGSLDTSFNAGGAKPGTLTTTVDNQEVQIFALALQADGKIVIAGQSHPVSAAAAARFNTDGTIDTSFNSAGVQPGTLALPTMDNLAFAFAYWVAVQTDGKIILGGGVYSSNLFGVARLNANGSIDTTFNPNGVQPGTVTTTVNNTPGEAVWDIAIQTNGRIVVSGQATGLNLFAVARFLNATTINNVCAS